MSLDVIQNRKVATWIEQLKHSCPWLLCFVLAYICSFFLSGVSAPQPDLDESYQVVLENARAHNFQFGKDIVFTFGPLGFLNTWVSLGIFPVQRILFALIWSGFVAWSATGLARQIPGRIKFVFLVWFLIYSHLGWLEQHAFLVMIYGCIILMGDVWKRKTAAIAFLVIFAILALIKFTFFMAAVLSVALCVMVHVGTRDVKSALAIPLCFISVLLALWVAEGQDIGNLSEWLRASFEIAGGYTDAMTIYPKIRVLITCASAGLMFIIAFLVIIKTARLSPRSVGILLAVTAYVFLAWKHAFVRADGHVIFFIFFLPIASAVFLTTTFRESMNRKAQMLVATLFIVVVLLCNWAADFQEPGMMLTKLVNWPRYMVGNSRQIVNSVAGNWENSFEALRGNPQTKREPDLSVARNVVGDDSVDVLNYRQSAALVNNLNYRPRPVIQGYSAYTPYLQDMNLSFYRSEKRPHYLLFKMETIDNRFPALDDAPLLPFILNNYMPVAKDGEFLVLRASQKIHSDDGLILVHDRAVAFGEYVDMSVYKEGLFLMQVDVETTLLGRLVKFLFQAPVLNLITKNDGKTSQYRFIPAMAERGFVISPVLLTNSDIVNFYDGAPVNSVDSICFSKPKSSGWQLSEKVKVKIYKSKKQSDRGA